MSPAPATGCWPKGTPASQDAFAVKDFDRMAPPAGLEHREVDIDLVRFAGRQAAQVGFDRAFRVVDVVL